ncbi:BsuPI-related putative proteinase inhibitor [Saliterribacillus persicus]|uniref:Intracellular proteinase inhibitor BsuPI n=1 Tax=Saliterribacillus persicus TaxID=930114 RepID=A0A368XT76_9BACI|nr:BsuPI-related putative proteinase inhibitor [Saliterribacillus persicus]RCW69717.1 intracellular proteinase inhibitor BsuPI [Saliterribacillus persicus]
MQIFKSSLFIMLLMLLIACGTNGDDTKNTNQSLPNEGPPEELPEEEPETDSTNENIDALLENMIMESNTNVNNGVVTFNFSLANENNEEINLLFSSGKQFDIIVTNEENETVYHYAEGKMFTEALVEKSLAKGEKLTWQEEWEESKNLPSGSYQVELTIIPAELNKQVVEDTPFTQSFELELQNENTEEVAEGDFQNVEVDGKDGQYMVTGQFTSDVEKAAYTVEDGHNQLITETEIERTNPSENHFRFEIKIEPELLSSNSTVMLVLYTLNDGQRGEEKPIILERR